MGCAHILMACGQLLWGIAQSRDPRRLAALRAGKTLSTSDCSGDSAGGQLAAFQALR
jgi:hypothetical protein